MRVLSKLAAFLSVASLVPQALTCALHARQETATNSCTDFPYMVPGDDNPSDHITAGTFVNHLGLNVRNASASIDWYTRALGMRHMFTEQVSAHFSISYMVHSQGGRNGSGYQTTEELLRNQRNSQGLLELVALEVPGWDLPSGNPVATTLLHIGLMVPDVNVTQKHLERMGASIRKAAHAPFSLDDGFAVTAGLVDARDRGEFDQEEWDLIEQVLKPVNEPLLWMEDPDGNIVEVSQQT